MSGGYFWGFRVNLALGRVFWGYLCVATRNLLLKRLASRGFGRGGILGILCVATGNLLLKRLAIWVLGDFWGLGGVFLGFSGKCCFGEGILGVFCV